MDQNIEDQKVPLQSESLAKGAHADPNDVGNARFYLDKATGSYIWGWPTYQNGRQVGARAVAPDKYTDPNQPNPSKILRFGPTQEQLDGTATDRSNPGGGGGGGNSGGIPGWLKTAASALPIAAAAATGGPGGNSSMSPELQQLLAQALKRMSSQDGLFAAINKQAMAGLPTIYQQ